MSKSKLFIVCILSIFIITVYFVSPSMSKKGYEEAMISMDLNNVPLTQVLKIMTEQSGVNFTVSKEVSAIRITARFDKVPVEEALNAISSAYGLIYERVGRTNSVVIRKRKRVSPRTNTEIVPLNHIQLTGLETDIEEESIAKNLTNIISNMLSEYGTINIDARTNSLVITDLPERIPNIKQVIRGLDIKVPQIEIEVEMVEVNSSAMTKLGLEVGGGEGEIISYRGPQRTTGFPLNKKGPDNFFDEVTDATFPEGIDSSFTYGTLSMAQFTVLLKAITSKGKGKFLARPRILTINNRKAKINITANTAIGMETEVDSETGLINYKAEREITGIILEVTPQVNREDYISMLVEPKVIRAQSSQFFPDRFVDPQTRSAKTSVVIKNGATLVIGGLVSDDDDKTVRKVPIIGHIPIIGWFFSGLDSDKSKKELLIFITPRVVESS